MIDSRPSVEAIPANGDNRLQGGVCQGDSAPPDDQVRPRAPASSRDRVPTNGFNLNSMLKIAREVSKNRVLQGRRKMIRYRVLVTAGALLGLINGIQPALAEKSGGGGRSDLLCGLRLRGLRLGARVRHGLPQRGG
jgi:hypothetical protein